MGFGFLTIWGGVFTIAFDTDATNQNMLVVFIGGLASFLATMGVIEAQSRKNGGQLYDLHNYFLGIAFFFSTIAAMWGARYLMALATGSFDMSLFGEPSEYTDADWAPNANGIYVQTLAVLGVTALHLNILNRYEGEKSFGFGVATYAPMVVLLGGVGPWIRWSGDIVSYELGRPLQPFNQFRSRGVLGRSHAGGLRVDQHQRARRWGRWSAVPHGLHHRLARILCFTTRPQQRSHGTRISVPHRPSGAGDFTHKIGAVEPRFGTPKRGQCS